MIPENVLTNFQSWLMQVFVIASVGAALPLTFRMRHPRSQLVYCHLLLAICLVLPAIQPWQHPVIVADNVQPATAAQQLTTPVVSGVARPVPWGQILAWIIIVGFAARLFWTAIGLWMIRRHKAAAIPLYPIPESITQACALTDTNALFCVSPDDAGPFTFGLSRPVVLLPASFTSLDEDAQCGIACHELLHVRRKDWLVNLVEEIVGAMVWFHPAFWWLIAQARLAREQLVDAEAVRVTAARESYISALLTMAGARPALDLVPASSFLRRRHLLQRMQMLVTEVSMSKARLVSSYAAMAVIVGAIGWFGFVSFPMTGLAEIKAPTVLAPAAPSQQNSPGYVVTIQPLRYPPEALQKKIEGSVVVELTFNAAGNVIDSRVISGPEELRQVALESALRGNYSINVARTLQVIVDFRLADAGKRIAPPPPPPPPPPPGALKGTIESIEVVGLAEPARTSVLQLLQAFQGQVYSADLVLRILESVRNEPGVLTTDRRLVSSIRKGTQDGSVVLVVNFMLISSQTGVVQTPFGAVVPTEIATPFGTQATGDITNVKTLTPISKVDPVYPPLARQARIQGVVVLQVTVNPQGTVENLKVVTGHPLLIQAAIDAVKQWRYEPQPDTVTTVATLNFAF